MDEISVKLDEVPTLRISLDNIVVKNVEAIKSHARLKDRDLSDQHPISAITGLEDALKSAVSEDKISEAVNAALAQAKASGEFNGDDGEDGKTPVKGVDYYTEADKSKFSEYIASELAKRGQLKPEFAQSEEWLKENGDRSLIYVLPNGDMWAWMLTEVESKPTYTNILPLAVNADGAPYVGLNGEKGYKTGWRLNSSKVEKEQVGMCCTGFMPITPSSTTRATGTLRLKNVTPTGASGGYLYSFGSDKTLGTGGSSTVATVLNNSYDATTEVYTLQMGYDSSGNVFTDGSGTIAGFGMLGEAKYLRLSIGNINENTIITWDEEITESGTSTDYAWASTGLAFVPADYEPRIIAVEERASSNTKRIIALEKSAENGGAGDTSEADALTRIKEWDKPVYDNAEVTLISEDRTKPALTASDRTISAIYAKYRALMAAHPRYITETNMGKCTASADFPAVDMLRFDFKEPEGLTDADYNTAKLHETKPTIIFMSGIHTEWVGVWGLYYALEEIATNPDFDDIRRNAHIVVIPCANPFCLSKQTVEGWTTSHVNANGVAIHNNFGVNHSTSGVAGEYNYGGIAPYSELETQYIDAVMAEYPDAVAFVSCHNNDYSTVFGAPVIWASSATYHMCNVAFRLIDKISKAWLNKYGDALKTAVDEYKVNMDDGDYRFGRAMMSSSKGTEQLNATKYGIQGVNLEISRMMKVFSGNTDGSSEVMTHGAEVYANFMRTLLAAYDHKDKKEYAPNLPWRDS